MKMYRILVSILVVGFAVNVCSCGLRTNDNSPDLTEEYVVDLRSDTINSVVPYGSGCIVALDSGEIRAIDETGTVVASSVFSEQITQMSAYEDGMIMIAFDDDSVSCLSVVDGEFTESNNVEFEHHIADISCIPYEDAYLVLLDNGELYGYGHNTHRMIDSQIGEDEIINEPVMISENIKCIESNYIVDNDNRVMDLLADEWTDPCDEEIIGIELYNYPIVYTDDAIYAFYTTNNTINKMNSINPGSFSCTASGYVYSLDGQYYYTGLLSATPQGKGLPEADNSPVEIPSDMSYSVIRHGVICYDAHRLICYSV